MESSIRILPKSHIIPSSSNPSLISSAASPPQFDGDPNHHQNSLNDHTIILVSGGSNPSEDHQPTLTTLTTSSTRRRSRRFEYGYETEEDEDEEEVEEYHDDDDEYHHARGFNANPLIGRDPRNFTMSSNSGLINPRVWACIEIVFTLGQVIIAMAMLMSSSPSSRDAELAPLWIWLAGYSMGCIASILLALWKLISQHSNHRAHRSGNHYANHNQYQSNHQQVQSNYIHHENMHHGYVAPLRPAYTNRLVKVWMGKMRMCLDFFFAVWFVLGNVWVFGRPSLAQQTPRLYRLCVAFLALSCVSYALPFVLCIALCCCLPCFLNMRGGRILHELYEARIYNNGVNASSSCGGGASAALIATIPTARFHPQSSLQLDDKNAYHVNDECDDDDDDDDCDNGDTTVRGAGGFIKCSNLQHNELLVEAEDAVCCICLRRYKENIELRTLPCSHHFHLLCVDQWLQIKASCPLCNSSLYPNIERTLLK